MNHQDLAAAIHRAAFLRDVNRADEIARLCQLPIPVVLDALRCGDLPGREFPGEGWRVTKRATLVWLESRAASSQKAPGAEAAGEERS